MSQRNSISRTLPACFDSIPASSGSKVATAGGALLALGVIGLVDATGAAAIYAAALTLGGLLLADMAAVKRSSNNPSRCVAARERVRVHPLQNR